MYLLRKKKVIGCILFCDQPSCLLRSRSALATGHCSILCLICLNVIILINYRRM